MKLLSILMFMVAFPNAAIMDLVLLHYYAAEVIVSYTENAILAKDNSAIAAGVVNFVLYGCLDSVLLGLPWLMN